MRTIWSLFIKVVRSIGFILLGIAGAGLGWIIGFGWSGPVAVGMAGIHGNPAIKGLVMIIVAFLGSGFAMWSALFCAVSAISVWLRKE